MKKNSSYDPLKFEEGLFPKFFAWCKRKWNIWVTIGSVGLIVSIVGVILTGAQTWQSFFGPNTAELIQENITSTLEEYKLLEKVNVPESLSNESNMEIHLLEEFQDEFDIYKIQLYRLDFSDIQEKDLSKRMRFYYSRISNINEYNNESNKIISLITRICLFERTNNPKGELVNKDILYDLEQIISFNDTIEHEQKELKNQLEFITKQESTINQLTNRERNHLFENLDKAYAGNNRLRMIRMQRDLFTSFYVKTSLRLKQIIHEKRYKRQY